MASFSCQGNDNSNPNRSILQRLSNCNEDYLKQVQFRVEQDMLKLKEQLDTTDVKLREKIMSYQSKIRKLVESVELLKGDQEKLVKEIDTLNNELLERDVGIESSKKVFAIEIGHMMREINDLRKALRREVGIRMELEPEVDELNRLIFNQEDVHSALEMESEFLNETIKEAKNPKSAIQNGSMGYPGAGASVIANSYALQNMQCPANAYRGGPGRSNSYSEGQNGYGYAKQGKNQTAPANCAPCSQQSPYQSY